MSKTLTSIRIVDAGGPHEKVTVELMRRERLFERFGVAVTKTYVTNGAEAAELLCTGQADVAMQVGFGPAMAAIARGAPLRVIAGSNLLTVHAVYATDPSICRLEDLAGKVVGVGRLGALTHQLIYAALLKHGVDPASVRFMSIGNSATIFKALVAGKVDAGFGETDVFENQNRYGVHALENGVLWRELPEFPNQTSFATREAIQTKRDALVRTLAAHAALYRLLHNPQARGAYEAAWTRALPQSPLDECAAQWSFYQRYRPFADDLRIPEAQVDYMQKLNVIMKLQDSVLPFAAVADVSLAREALRLLEETSE